MSFDDALPLVVKEVSVLEKFEGDPLPENLVEKIHIEDGQIIKQEFYNGADNLIETLTDEFII